MKAKRSFWLKSIAVFTGLTLLTQTFYPTVAMALTGGPSQPEMQGFTPVGTTNMVDLSSGSFTYNIPLMDVEGYPINLSYHSGITMDQEASWVGLGWNINPGEINRQMRGIPDDFNGDQVTEKFNLRNNITAGLSAGGSLKTFGIIGIGLDAGVFYNNYNGPGVTVGVNPSLSTGVGDKGSLNCGLGLNFNSQSGVSISPTIGFEEQAASDGINNVDAGIKVGTTYNSRTGVKGLQMTTDLNVTHDDIRHDPGATLSSSFISFAGPTYIPTIKMPLQNFGVTLDVTLGAAFFAIHPNTTFSGWFSEQSLATNSQTVPAYGYMYADQANNNPSAMHDFNREKDIPFLPQIANLPITNFTYDLYSVNGEGVSGQFRPFRGDVGILYDRQNSNTSLSGSLGIELGVGEVSHNGVEVNASASHTTTSQWLSDNQFVSTVHFQSLQPGNINYEPFYMKRIGEKTVNNTAYYNTIGDANPVYVSLDNFGGDVTARNMFNIGGGRMYIGSNLARTQREKRNQCTSLLTAGEAQYFGLDKSILSYPLNNNVYSSQCSAKPSIKSIPRLTWPSWHTSEFTVTNPDGKRYIYGLPAYNTVHNEVSFSVKGQSYLPSNDNVNMVHYSGTDRSINNSEGLEHYYDEQQLPPYAHSYLLTGVLSPDYVDMTGDGITDDDLGQAVKINYTQVYSQTNPYRWRVPVEQDSANYQVGMMSYNQDDKGNIMYGEKEVWDVHSIESKTMVAQFILSARQDGLGVLGEEGGIDGAKPLYKLDEIQLFSKADLIAHGSNAVPVKTVHFVYDYSLCPGTPNSTATSGKGKLTLKSVYFTYGNNNEGALNSYQFSYNGRNPSFSHSAYDRWGYYKNPASNPGTKLYNQDFPYTSQNADSTDAYSTAWNMTDIGLPSGGHITVKYQPNNYAYVQNQRATQMFTLLGASSSSNGTPSGQLFTKFGPWNDWLIFQLPAAVDDRTDFQNEYLSGINQLYFRFAVDVDGSGHYEYVPGYANIADYQPADVAGDKWAIKLSEVSTGDPVVGNSNPVSLASWQYVRLNLPQYAYPGSQMNGSVLSMIMSVFGILFDIVDIFVGFDGRMYAQGGGQTFIPDHSWIRLDNPNYQKLGGGTRVGEIDISDNWANMVSGQGTYTYGQTYNYTTTLSVNGQTKAISSGVATYEPLQGGDENPLRNPLPYTQQQILAPNNSFYTETPLGESLYPAAGVVYSKVTVTNLLHPGTERTETGSTVNEFYTANDFPVLNNWTALDNIRIKPNILSSIFSLGIKDYTTASQGFAVEVNDMPGKEKGQEAYDQNGSMISSVHYYYHTDNPSASPMHLNNNVTVVNPDGSLGTASIGKDIDTYEDMRQQETVTQSFGGTFNGEFFVIPFFPPIPTFIPIIIPSYSSEDTRFRAAVTTKYIYRCGLVDSVVNMKYGSYVTTQNVAYDGETGNVLLTQTHNEFNKAQYGFTFPAYFAYPGMGSEFTNIGTVVNATVSGGLISCSPGPSTFFTPGDQVEWFYPGNPIPVDSLLWITQPQTGGSLVMMDQAGYPVTLNGGSSVVQLKVTRSGYRNMAGTPIGSVQCMNSPIVGSNIVINSSSNVVQANATLFNNAWPVPITMVPKSYCFTPDNSPSLTCIANFMDSLIKHNEVFASLSDNITLGRYCPSCSDTSALYYTLVQPTGPNGYVSRFSAQLGDCILTIGQPVYMDLPKFTYTSPESCITYSHPAEQGTMCVSCQQCQTVCVDQGINDAFNPYALGMLGNWRPERNYVYYTERTPVLTASTSNIWSTGTFSQYSPIWDSHPGNLWTLDTSDKNWTWTSLITMYDTKGNEIEDKDALGRYSGALYGYLQSVPTAVSSNAKYCEIGYDGFEDYGFITDCNTPCDNSHFSFINYKGDTTSKFAHTGKYSLAVSAGHSDTVTRSINYFSSAFDSTDATHYYLKKGGGIPLFSPDSGLYLLSAWVKENTCGQTGYPKDSILVSYHGSPLVYVFHSSGTVIDGWQRIEGKFKVPGSATQIDVSLVAGPNTAYYDDIRVEPFAAEMKTYSYDPSNLRLLGTLDENNYATIYEYNDEGILMRVKKETDEGIMTIKESRSSYVRQ